MRTMISEADVEERRRALKIAPDLPHNFPYPVNSLHGNCENVIGYVPIPVGVAGPLPVDGIDTMIPLATTEGALIASINRGCKLLRMSSIGVRCIQTDEGMTRGPVVMFPDAIKASQFVNFVHSDEGFQFMKQAFDSTSNHARLLSITAKLAGRSVYMRFKATTGEAMGMNMIGKGSQEALKAISTKFPEMDIISLSGNYCTDKRASALNWIEGRGRSIVAEAILSREDIERTLHTTVERLFLVHQQKCLIGSSLSGSIGGSNAHAANIVAATFVATGQDVAQIVDSSFCLTLLSLLPDNVVHVSVTMPCLQVGTIGGGTRLPPQQACLSMMTSDNVDHGQRSMRLAKCIAAAVLAGELSLLGALAEGSLMDAHLRLNRPSARSA